LSSQRTEMLPRESQVSRARRFIAAIVPQREYRLLVWA
jgi:hypothetical protein